MYKIILLLSLAVFLNGCVQSTAMVGPAVTFASTGNIYNAGFSLGANKAVENETGMTTSELITKQVNKNKDTKIDKELENSLKILLDLNIQKTHSIISKKKNKL